MGSRYFRGMIRFCMLSKSVGRHDRMARRIEVVLGRCLHYFGL